MWVLHATWEHSSWKFKLIRMTMLNINYSSFTVTKLSVRSNGILLVLSGQQICSQLKQPKQQNYRIRKINILLYFFFFLFFEKQHFTYFIWKMSQQLITVTFIPNWMRWFGHCLMPSLKACFAYHCVTLRASTSVNANLSSILH